ncbi:MAG: DUF1629 domain-containing protein [Hyphomicrobiaceae bacterium]
MAYYVSPAPGIVTGGVDKMPDNPMQPWYRTHTGPLEPWMLGYFPSTLRYNSESQPTDVVTFRLWGVSEAIKNIIEKFEPEAIQFIPFKLMQEQSDKCLSYYTLWINRQIDAVDLSRSNIDGGTTVLEDGAIHQWWSKRINTPLSIKRAAVKDAHLWRTKAYTFISSQLHDELQKAKLGSGWLFEQQITI